MLPKDDSGLINFIKNASKVFDERLFFVARIKSVLKYNKKRRVLPLQVHQVHCIHYDHPDIQGATVTGRPLIYLLVSGSSIQKFRELSKQNKSIRGQAIAYTSEHHVKVKFKVGSGWGILHKDTAGKTIFLESDMRKKTIKKQIETVTPFKSNFVVKQKSSKPLVRNIEIIDPVLVLTQEGTAGSLIRIKNPVHKENSERAESEYNHNMCHSNQQMETFVSRVDVNGSKTSDTSLSNESEKLGLNQERAEPEYTHNMCHSNQQMETIVSRADVNGLKTSDTSSKKSEKLGLNQERAEPEYNHNMCHSNQQMETFVSRVDVNGLRTSDTSSSKKSEKLGLNQERAEPEYNHNMCHSNQQMETFVSRVDVNGLRTSDTSSSKKSEKLGLNQERAEPEYNHNMCHSNQRMETLESRADVNGSKTSDTSSSKKSEKLGLNQERAEPEYNHNMCYSNQQIETFVSRVDVNGSRTSDTSSSKKSEKLGLNQERAEPEYNHNMCHSNQRMETIVSRADVNGSKTSDTSSKKSEKLGLSQERAEPEYNHNMCYSKQQMETIVSRGDVNGSRTSDTSSSKKSEKLGLNQERAEPEYNHNMCHSNQQMETIVSRVDVNGLKTSDTSSKKSEKLGLNQERAEPEYNHNMCHSNHQMETFVSRVDVNGSKTFDTSSSKKSEKLGLNQERAESENNHNMCHSNKQLETFISRVDVNGSKTSDTSSSKKSKKLGLNQERAESENNHNMCHSNKQLETFISRVDVNGSKTSDTSSSKKSKKLGLNQEYLKLRELKPGYRNFFGIIVEEKMQKYLGFDQRNVRRAEIMIRVIDESSLKPFVILVDVKYDNLSHYGLNKVIIAQNVLVRDSALGLVGSANENDILFKETVFDDCSESQRLGFEHLENWLNTNAMDMSIKTEDDCEMPQTSDVTPENVATSTIEQTEQEREGLIVKTEIKSECGISNTSIHIIDEAFTMSKGSQSNLSKNETEPCHGNETSTGEQQPQSVIKIDFPDIVIISDDEDDSLQVLDPSNEKTTLKTESSPILQESQLAQSRNVTKNGLDVPEGRDFYNNESFDVNENTEPRDVVQVQANPLHEDNQSVEFRTENIEMVQNPFGVEKNGGVNPTVGYRLRHADDGEANDVVTSERCTQERGCDSPDTKCFLKLASGDRKISNTENSRPYYNDVKDLLRDLSGGLSSRRNAMVSIPSNLSIRDMRIAQRVRVMVDRLDIDKLKRNISDSSNFSSPPAVKKNQKLGKNETKEKLR